jgi:aminocarboxymuconate-semialdehyde decarboxylase
VTVTTIDIHAHLFPPSAMDNLRAGRPWYGSTLEQGSRGNPILVTNGRKRALGADSHLIDKPGRVARMDELRVDVQVLSLVPLLFGYDLGLDDAVAMTRDTNDEIAGYIRDYPGRFLGLANVPVNDTDKAIAELERAMGLEGFVGLTLGSNVGGRSWDDHGLFPILEAAERLNAYVFFHPIDVRAGNVLTDYYTRNLIGNPLETTMLVASLIFGGVLDRLPNLRLCLAHGGGYATFAIGRFDHGKRVRPEAEHLQCVPSDLLQRFHVDALVHSEQAVRYLVDVMGVERVVLGSDFPADMGPVDPVGEIERNPLLTDDEKRAILGGNLERELGLAAGAAAGSAS